MVCVLIMESDYARWEHVQQKWPTPEEMRLACGELAAVVQPPEAEDLSPTVMEPDYARWEQLRQKWPRPEEIRLASGELEEMVRPPEAEDLSPTIMDPGNTGGMALLSTEGKINSHTGHPTTQPFECLLLKQEHYEEDQPETEPPTETQMFECVYVKQEFPEDEEKGTDSVDRKDCVFPNTTHAEPNCQSIKTDDEDQPDECAKTAIKTEGASHAVTSDEADDDAVSERSVPSDCDDFTEPPNEGVSGPENLSQQVIDSDCSRSTHYDPNESSDTEEEDEEFSCNACSKVFKSKHSLMKHVSIHMFSTRLASYMCEMCGELVDSADQLSEHAMSVHDREIVIPEDSDVDDDTFLSNYCATVYNEDCSPLDMSKKSHTRSGESVETKKGRCSLCTKLFKSSREANNHVCIKGKELGHRLASHGKPHKQDCSSPDLGKSFTPTVKARIRPRGVQKLYACDLCSKSFPKPCQLNYHMRTHTGERPYDCTLCGKTFAKRAHLNVHNRTHTGEKPFACEVCGKSFTESCKRNRHMLSHKGEKPYVCNVCGKCYSASSSLSSHKRLHTGNNLNECDVCGKSFPRPSVLRVHLRSHTGEKPHKCRVCEKSFTQIGNLKRHIQSHLSGTLQI